MRGEDTSGWIMKAEGDSRCSVFQVSAVQDTIKLHSENTVSINYTAGGVTLQEEINHLQNTSRRAV